MKLEVPFEVLFGDSDPSGWVYYAAVFHYVAQAEARLFREAGFTGYAIIQEGYGLPRAHLEADYRHPLKVHDRGVVRAWIGHLGNSSIRMEFELIRDGEQEAAVTGHIVMVTVDIRAEQAIPIPDSLRSGLMRFTEPE